MGRLLALCGLLSAASAWASGRVVVDLPLPAPSAPTPLATGVTTAISPPPATATPGPTPSRSTQQSQPVSAEPEPEPEPARTVQFALPEGQSLYEQFLQHDLDRSALVTMVRQDRRIKKALRRLRPGHRVRVQTLDGRIQELVLERPGPKDLMIRRTADDRFRLTSIDNHAFTALADSAPGGPPASPSADSAPSATVVVATADASQPAPEPAAAPVPEKTDAAPSPPLATAADAAPAGSADTATAPPVLPHVVTVKPGDSLYRIFRRLDIPPQDLARLLDADEQARRLKSLHPGQELLLTVTHDGRLHGVRVELDEENTLSAERAPDDGYRVAVAHRPLERRVATASAVIENSLFLAGQRAGLADGTIMELTEIFGWDVDFALDVRAGDRFTVIHEEYYKDGEKVRNGPILASEFVNRGRAVRAIRFVDDDGRSTYFSPDGLSMRKAFLRTPVRFSRISSRFSRGRMHPVLNRMRAHKGVDYAAPTGTPIKATGDGRVVFAGRKGGYGRTVVIQHGSTYTTLYAHMSRLHRRARQGNRVRQGDIVGYVGSTGLATGPHLHYEFRVRGKHVDPLRVELPKALPIEARYKTAFERTSRPLIAQLDTLASTSLASRD